MNSEIPNFCPLKLVCRAVAEQPGSKVDVGSLIRQIPDASSQILEYLLDIGQCNIVSRSCVMFGKGSNLLFTNS